MAIHAELAAGRWFDLSLVEQLAHIGSEVDRAIRAWNAGKQTRFVCHLRPHLSFNSGSALCHRSVRRRQYRAASRG